MRTWRQNYSAAIFKGPPTSSCRTRRFFPNCAPCADGHRQRYSGKAGAWRPDLDDIDPRRGSALPELFGRGCGAETEQRRAIRTAEDTGNGAAARHGNALQFLAIAVDPDERVLVE